MNLLIIIINSISLFAGISALILIIRAVKKKKLFPQSGGFLSVSVTIISFVFISNILEYGYSISFYDRYEEYFELLIIPSLIIFFYSLDTEKRIVTIENNRQKLEKMLDERTLFIQELHHRIKNNLQLIMSIINLQLGKVTNSEVEAALGSIVNRIDSIGLAQNFIYDNENVTEIRLEYCFSEIVYNLINFYKVNSNRLSIRITDTGITRNIDTTIFCCILINELVSNTLLYSLEEDKICKIEITAVEIDDDNFEIVYSDNGPGIDKQHSIGRVQDWGL